MSDHMKTAPSAQQAAGSIDTPEFWGMASLAMNIGFNEQARAALIAHIHAWAAATPAQPIAPPKVHFMWSSLFTNTATGIRFALSAADRSDFDLMANELLESPEIDTAKVYEIAVLKRSDYESLASPVAQPIAVSAPTEISERLRERARGGYTAVSADDGALMLKAADEIERYYGGMMAWKQTAMKKDADFNAERMDRINERCAARAAAPVSGQGASIGDDAEFKKKLSHLLVAERQANTKKSMARVAELIQDFVQFIDSRPRSEDSRAFVTYNGPASAAGGMAITINPDGTSTARPLPSSSEDSRAEVRSSALKEAFNECLKIEVEAQRMHDAILKGDDGDESEATNVFGARAVAAKQCGLAISALASTTPQKADDE